MEPAGTPKGAVVPAAWPDGLALQPAARRTPYADRGFVAIGIRMPGPRHGARRPDRRALGDWSAATRLAIREARRRVPAPAPLHLVGFSNGGALAVKYALDAIEDPRAAARRPPRAVHADDRHHALCAVRRAGRACPPCCRRSPRRLAQQHSRVQSVQVQLVSGQRRAPVVPPDGRVAGTDPAARPRGRLDTMPPVLTFQSVIDFTVSTPAILAALYAFLPDNGSEIVLFDVNRTVKFGPLLRPSSYVALDRLTPTTPQTYRFTAIVNAGDDTDATVERSIAPGQLDAVDSRSTCHIRAAIFSLSHLAIPIPPDDPLYGTHPDPKIATRVRTEPRCPRRAGRARCAHRRSGLPDAVAVEPVLPVPARARRGGHRSAGRRERSRARGDTCAGGAGPARSPAVDLRAGRRGRAAVRRTVSPGGRGRRVRSAPTPRAARRPPSTSAAGLPAVPGLPSSALRAECGAALPSACATTKPAIAAARCLIR